MSVRAREFRELTDDELRHRLRELSDALPAFRLQLVTGVAPSIRSAFNERPDNVRILRKTRRNIARINTILREREMAASRGAK